MTKIVLCVPTEIEFKLLAPRVGRRRDTTVEVLGFGPIAAAARTAWLIGEHRPQRMFLLGIAGSYSSDLPVGTATQFQKVGCYGVGIGSGALHRSAFDVGFAQTQVLAHPGQQARSDILPLEFAAPLMNSDLLLTVCAAAADPVDVDLRLEQFPGATAEDMEGFGFAFACQQAGVGAQIIRGISNAAGQRDRKLWQVDVAADAAAKLFDDVFDSVLC